MRLIFFSAKNQIRELENKLAIEIRTKQQLSSQVEEVCKVWLLFIYFFTLLICLSYSSLYKHWAYYIILVRVSQILKAVFSASPRHLPEIFSLYMLTWILSRYFETKKIVGKVQLFGRAIFVKEDNFSNPAINRNPARKIPLVKSGKCADWKMTLILYIIY